MRGFQKGNCYLFILEEVESVVQVVHTGVEFFIVSFALTEFKSFGFKLGNDDILVVRFNLIRVVVSLKKKVRMEVEVKVEYLSVRGSHVRIYVESCF